MIPEARSIPRARSTFMNHRRGRDIEGGTDHHLPPEEATPRRFRWIVDGHNAIFAIREWEELQVAGRRRDARLALEESLEAFGRAVGSCVWVVYDGNAIERNPDVVARPNLKSWFSIPPAEADDMICYLAAQAQHAGELPRVVTSDRRTLASALPPGCRSMEVRDFFRRVHARALFVPEKRPPEGMDEIERHFLSRSPHEDDRREARRRGPGSGPGDGAGADRQGEGPPS
jgi:predicted RNA-binding protein with PIN domain